MTGPARRAPSNPRKVEAVRGQSGQIRDLRPFPSRRTEGARARLRSATVVPAASLARAPVLYRNQEQRVVALPLGVAAVGRFEQGFDLRLVQVGQDRDPDSTERDPPDPCGLLDQFRCLAPDEAEQRVEGGKALVASRWRIPASLFEVSEELAQQGVVDLFDGDAGRIGGMVFGEELKQEPDR